MRAFCCAWRASRPCLAHGRGLPRSPRPSLFFFSGLEADKMDKADTYTSGKIDTIVEGLSDGLQQAVRGCWPCRARLVAGQTRGMVASPHAAFLLFFFFLFFLPPARLTMWRPMLRMS